ncbi:MAG: four helix bundle protein [Deltaproteobacteria bacterium]|jgi:four helix bundle protein|nr:four helix bundle protein [Deltaproteobacteria bacterium]
MKKITKFEDLIAWQKARELTKEIYTVSTSSRFEKDFGLRSQIQRACVSVMSNIAEGFERAGRAEFHQFLVIAKGSCAEVKSHLYVAYDVGYISKKKFEKVKMLVEEVSQIIGGLRSAIQKQRDVQK